MQLALQGKLWKEWLDKGEAREQYMGKWRAKQELMEGKRHERYLREGNPFKDMVKASVIHDRRFERLDRARPHQMLVDGHEGEERGHMEERRGDIEEVESENYVSDLDTDIVDRRDVPEDDGNDSDAWTLGYETNSPAEFSRTGTQMETEEGEECMLFNHTSKRQRGRGLVFGKARDSQVRGQGIGQPRRDSSRMGQCPTTNMAGEGQQGNVWQNEELRGVERRMANAEGRALSETREGDVEEAQPSVRWVSEIEHMAAVARPERVPFVSTWKRAVVQGLRGDRGGAVGEQEILSEPRRLQAGVQRGTPARRQNLFYTLRQNGQAVTGQPQGDTNSTRNNVGDSRVDVNGSGTGARNVDLSISEEARVAEHRTDLRDNVSDSDSEGVRGGAEGSIAGGRDNAEAVQEFIQWFQTSEEDRQAREVVGRRLEELVGEVGRRVQHQQHVRSRQRQQRKRQAQGGHRTSQEERNEEG